MLENGAQGGLQRLLNLFLPFLSSQEKGNDLGVRSIVACVLAPNGNETQSFQSSGEKFDANMRDKKEGGKKYEKSGKNNRRRNSLSVASFIRA